MRYYGLRLGGRENKEVIRSAAETCCVKDGIEVNDDQTVSSEVLGSDGGIRTITTGRDHCGVPEYHVLHPNREI